MTRTVFKVVTATDEDELAARIRKAEEENQEVDGDDDDDEQVRNTIMQDRTFNSNKTQEE